MRVPIPTLILTYRHHDGIIPRTDGSNYTERAKYGTACFVIGRVDDIAMNFIGPTSKVAETSNRVGHIPITSDHKRFTTIEYFQLGQFNFVPFHQVGKFVKVTTSLGSGFLSPHHLEGFRGSFHSGVYILFVGRLDFTNDLFIHRVNIFKKRTMTGNKCVVNEEVSMD
jgi:hypothetical protein